jgi:HK97 family phage major capsid protein
MSKKPAPTPSTIAPGTSLTRGFAVERAMIDTEARTVELAFASETPYERWWGIEILDCSPTAMRMGRLTSGGPLLADHDTRDQIGVIESVQIGADRVARAVVRFGKSERAEEMFRDVVDGIRRNVSVGYQIHKAVLVEENDDMGTYRATDWEPYEVSLVSVPADTTVGIGRSARAADDVSPLIPLVTKEAIMQTPEVVAAPAPAAPAISSADVQNQLAAERTRIREMIAIGDQFARYNGVALAKEAIEKGESIDALRSKVMNAMTAAQTTQVTNLDLSPKEQKRFSMFKAIRAMQGRDGDSWEKTAGFEFECHREILKRAGLETSVHGGFYVPMDVQKRDLTVGVSTAGGNLVATNLVPSSFIDLLRARTRAAQLGATMLSGLVGNVTIPKLTGAATGYWLANEATPITESQQTIGQLALAPKTLGAYTELSRQLMMQSTPAAEQLVMDDLAKVMALAIDLAVFEGSGSSGQPTGISVTGGIGSVTGGSLDLADCIEFQTDLAAGNALVDGCAYITTPAVAGLLKGRVRVSSTDSVMLWQGSVLDGMIEGFRATTSTQLTAASMIFGDFSQVVIAEWGMLEIALNPYAAFPTAITGIRAIQSVDVGIRQAAAFSRATSIT